MRALALLLVLAAVPGATSCTKEEAAIPDAGIKLDTVQPGQHLVDLVQYNDVNDVYRVFLVGRAEKSEPQRLTNVRLAFLSDDDVKAGKKPHLTDDGTGPVLWLGKNFRIGYLHGVVEEQVDAASGKKTNVVLRFEKRYWSPFQTANALGGAAVFGTPAYYFAPPWTDGPLVGIGGMGPTREVAWDAYRVTNGTLPQPVKLANEGFIEKEKQAPSDGGVAVESLDGGTVARAKKPARRVIGVVPGSPAARRELLKKQQASKALTQGKKQPGAGGKQPPASTKNKQPAPAAQKKP